MKTSNRSQRIFEARPSGATRLGLKVIEVHIAHGYLLHQFHSPLSNRRDDAWGGDEEKRMAFPLHIAETIRHAASGAAVGARITGSDWAGDGLATADAIALATRLKAAGIDYACVTSSGIPVSNPTVANPDLEQLALAAAVRRESGITTRAVGLITGAQQANDIIESGKADQVCSRSGIPRRSTMGLAQRLRSWRDPSLSFPVRLGSPVRVERLAATQGLNPAALQSG